MRDYAAAGGNVPLPAQRPRPLRPGQPRAVLSTIEDWRIGSGDGHRDRARPFNSLVLDRYRELAPDCMGAWLVYWRQNMPGRDNRQKDEAGRPMKNPYLAVSVGLTASLPVAPQEPERPDTEAGSDTPPIAPKSEKHNPKRPDFDKPQRPDGGDWPLATAFASSSRASRGRRPARARRLEVGLLHPLDGGPQVLGRLVRVSQAELVAADQAPEMRQEPVEFRIQAGGVVVHRLEELDGGLRIAPVGQRWRARRRGGRPARAGAGSSHAPAGSEGARHGGGIAAAGKLDAGQAACNTASSWSLSFLPASRFERIASDCRYCASAPSRSPIAWSTWP